MVTGETRQRIEEQVEAALTPIHLEVHDDSAEHAGHPGALISGGGHFRIVCASERFEGLSLLEQHRLVHEAVGYPMDGRIHALQIKTVPASRWKPLA